MKQRQLIGPTIITLLLCGLVADYLFLSESTWSVSSFFAKFLAVLGGIFGPAVNPENLSWLGNISVPVILMLAAVVLLGVIIARAKKSMREATSSPDAQLQAARQAAPRISVQASELTTAPVKPVTESRRYPVVVKLTVGFGAIGMLFGVAVCLIALTYFGRFIEKEAKNRAQAMALGLSDVAFRQMGSKDLQMLNTAVNNAVSIDAVAFVYVEDSSGEMIAFAPSDLPRFLNRDFPRSAERALNGIETQYRNADVYEVAKRVGDGKSGYVHLGVWRDAISADARAAVRPIAASIVLLVIAISGLFAFLATRLHRPFLELVEQAERISKGDFDVPLRLKREDEFGEIARSLERMRSSLHAVVRRLEQTNQPEQSGKET
jgi:HAMP domain-containing protein